jgi:ABC-type Fe3+-hydroxamate transport system substrate-binding protein
MRKKRLLLLALLGALLVMGGLSACGKAPEEEVPESAVLVEAVTLNPHPTSLEGKTVLLRWNGKPNGDKLLTRVGELLTEQVKDVKVIKMWEVDPSTAVSSDSAEVSAEIAEKIAAQKPDIVIASQCD